ncbi:MAG: hypothetical protein ACFB2X_06350 [Rivularia sp. (in: cyanobacteria)]
MIDEMRLLERRLDADLPTLGICLRFSTLNAGNLDLNGGII